MQFFAPTCSEVQFPKNRTQNPSEATSWGFDSPSRHHLSYLFSVTLQGAALAHPDTSGTNTGTVRILFIFNRLMFLAFILESAIYI